GSVSSVNWSVFGVNDLNNPPDNSSVTQTDPNTLWNTDAASSPTPHVSTSAVQLNVVEEIETIAGSSTSPSQGGPVTDLTSGSNFGAVEVVNGVTVSGNTTPTGYGYTPTIGPNGNFSDEWYDVENTGASTSDLYQSNPSSSPYGTPKATYLGNFVLDSSGDLTFNPAPEPSTWAMLGTGLVSLLAFNRYRRNK
ncbi:MAG: PEP-CTERM sorting domain-containing protein, partial [Verrucomicrobiota bacterium]